MEPGAALPPEAEECPQCTVSTRAEITRAIPGRAQYSEPRFVEPSRQSAHHKYGGFWIRAGALLLDSAILSPIGLVAGFLSGAIGGALAAVLTAGTATTGEYAIARGVLALIAGTLLHWLYFAFLESSPLQGTFGKWLFGLRVTDLYGTRISWRQANVRYWSKLLSALILGIGFMMAGWSAEKAALHDDIAKTRVPEFRYISPGVKTGYVIAALTVLLAVSGIRTVLRADSAAQSLPAASGGGSGLHQTDL